MEDGNTFRKGDTIELTVTDLAEKEQCFGRLDNGMAVMVSGMLAIGDRVSAKIKKVKQRYIEAIAVEVLEASPDRTEPVCSYFGVCGGCKLMHIRYDAQLVYKQKKVKDALEHLGDFVAPPVMEALACREPFHYRNKIEFSCSNMRYLLPEELSMETLARPKEFALGFHTPGNFEKVIDIDYCYLAKESMNRVLALTREFALANALVPYGAKAHTGFLRNLVVRFSENREEVMVNLVTSWYDEPLMERYRMHLESGMAGQKMTVVNNVTERKNTVATGEKEFTLSGAGYITERLGALDFRISANSFFQTNSSQAELLYQSILEVAGLRAEDTVYDLYCGTGTITLYLAKHCRQVVGLEVVESSINDARSNAAFNSIDNVAFFQVDLKDFQGMLDLLGSYDAPGVIITDPPRAGMHPKALSTMLRLRPRRIIYVSCNPASLARDGKEICLQGYKLLSVQPVDMFPHTSHIESVACFERVGLVTVTPAPQS
ncbi:23S rRNA (uracil(1939)-C(5))-methyltransferase RlmD [Pelodictyon phaeoclathratiforme]|jgi:23S rRNA (uracil1939-C5)-methyltransferase|uniref:RNA methyltransferase, TrmA family n=1 Tax=Pelodictyon phaeoclathratiforme (strain DSM 5477 / BU-1) TaxID=324925 RepID=B4SHF9_PELPB|nr:23S rRNA (uracil(1939)-C(5))-methyltransferase RlmD [Pelodictyon phaeoclathratiforme]ACF45052.1 RNA methyltransferase, TrmA family [Pelodictyon phaeoclathratiforme BU-1]MBV5288596.1 23S rRNA (uracil(1939)-C(5))-methyltransferase RlmD [Pelodictyon phaeoclathratiforme]